MKGVIFELQKFALHDGPGIRTVVFLKGCPLRCEWCSNPESFLKEPQLLYDKNKCNGSLKCVQGCPENAIQNGKPVTLNFEKCTACGKCIPVCTPEALKIAGWESDVDSILKEVIKDKAYFENSGGGITLSGGEPMFQTTFALELMKKAKREGIHTCLETSGYAYQQRFQEIIPYTDIFLYDFKHFDDEFHRQYTGRSNKMILSNLEYLNSENARIVLRCPIIPGINDYDKHFEAITEISNKYRNIEKVEIMPYHNYGAHKFEWVGLGPSKVLIKTVEKTKSEKWKKLLREMGCSKLI